jgi:hypothetical protein
MSLYLIAEIGINHNGDINIAKKLIDHAADAGFRAWLCRAGGRDFLGHGGALRGGAGGGGEGGGGRGEHMQARCSSCEIRARLACVYPYGGWPLRSPSEAATRNGGTELNSGQQRAWGARSSAE